MSPLKRIYTLIVIFVVISLALVFLGVLPSFSGVKQSSQEFLSAKNKLAFLTLQKNKLTQTQKLYERYRQDLANLDNVFVNAEVPLELISFLEDTATSSGIQLTVTSITKEVTETEDKGTSAADKKNAKEKDVWPSLLLQLSAEGSFSNFSKFLTRLESASYLIEVLDLTARKVPESENISFNMSIKVFAK